MALKIKQVRSTIGSIPKHRKTMQALGLGKIGKIVVREDNEAVRGMIRQVQHLIMVEEA